MSSFTFVSVAFVCASTRFWCIFVILTCQRRRGKVTQSNLHSLCLHSLTYLWADGLVSEERETSVDVISRPLWVFQKRPAVGSVNFLGAMLHVLARRGLEHVVDACVRVKRVVKSVAPRLLALVKEAGLLLRRCDREVGPEFSSVVLERDLLAERVLVEL